METQHSAAAPQNAPRVTLTQQEYEVARGLVAKRPNTFSEAGVNLKGALPWNKPDELIPRVRIKDPDVGDLAAWARTRRTSYLIQFLTTPSDYSPDSLGFGSRYVRAWLELEHRVHVFEQKPTRAEKRARIGTMIAIVGLLIAAITLALSFFKAN